MWKFYEAYQVLGHPGYQKGIGRQPLLMLYLDHPPRTGWFVVKFACQTLPDWGLSLGEGRQLIPDPG